MQHRPLGCTADGAGLFFGVNLRLLRAVASRRPRTRGRRTCVQLRGDQTRTSSASCTGQAASLTAPHHARPRGPVCGSPPWPRGQGSGISKSKACRQQRLPVRHSEAGSERKGLNAANGYLTAVLLAPSGLCLCRVGVTRPSPAAVGLAAVARRSFASGEAPSPPPPAAGGGEAAQDSKEPAPPAVPPHFKLLLPDVGVREGGSQRRMP